ncbi:MAG TPA: hypothetical protein VF824_00750 [Thermoanaerobaculia bacterium]|jgi:hypothetical protein
MKKEQETSEAKKPYEKPSVTRFPLRPEEAVLGFCKSNAAAGPSGGGCRSVDQCFAGGS